MDRKKIIYIGSILLVTVFVSVTYFSYAFFTSKNEYHGRVNMVVGTLDYKLKSSLLSNNSITLASNEKARLHIEIESLNDINSKYELYYTTTNNNIEIGYNTANDLPTGIINSKGKKTVTVIIKNPSNSSATVTFGVQGGFTHNTLVLETGKTSLTQIQSSYCEVAANTVFEYDYTGSGQEFEVPCSGNYKVELWGASGGSFTVGTTSLLGGYGGYSVGETLLNSSDILYIGVGGLGDYCSTTSSSTACSSTYSYNGGSACSTLTGYSTNKGAYACGSGGGATHVASNTNLGELKNYINNKNNILIVAGGGGGANLANSPYNYGYGGPGGGYKGVDGIKKGNDNNIGTGGAQTGTNNYFGTGRNGGGGGYYGGSGNIAGSGGGAGYIGNSNLTNKSMYCYDCGENDDTDKYTVSTYGTTTHQSERNTTNCPDGYSSNPVSKCAKDGNGYAKITFLSESTAEEKTNIVNIVTFNNNGDTTIPIKVLEPGSVIGVLPTPTSTNTTAQFDGWYLENNFVTKVDSNYIPTENTTLYAKWLLPYTITNMITNGSFEENYNTCYISGRCPTKTNSMSVYGNYSINVNATVENVSNSEIAYKYSGINLVQNHKYYFSIYEKLNSFEYAGDGIPIVYIAKLGDIVDTEFDRIETWKKMSNLITASSTITSNDVRIGKAYNNKNYVFNLNLDGFILVDLTETFGIGNEPTKEWCDSHIEFFDGTSTIYK